MYSRFIGIVYRLCSAERFGVLMRPEEGREVTVTD